VISPVIVFKAATIDTSKCQLLHGKYLIETNFSETRDKSQGDFKKIQNIDVLEYDAVKFGR
jgi:hypothetical protein